ncbi:DJ-1/PfpI family protein [Mycoplasmatota bacterium zrk1]
MRVAYYLYDGYSQIEISIPEFLFRKEETMTLSSNQDVVVCQGGKRSLIDYSVSEVNPEDIDVLIIPGGKANIEEDILKLIKDCEKQGIVIGAICAGVDYLLHAGVLNDRKYTGFFDRDKTYDFLPKDGILTYKMYESDKNIITARPEAYLEFALELYHLAGFRIDSTDGFVEWFKSPLCWTKK